MSSDPDDFPFRDDAMYAGSVPLTALAEAYGTPLYVYHAAIIRRQVYELRDAFAKALPPSHQPLIAYACKANTNGTILRLMAQMRLGADVVSAGEMTRALAAGIPAEKIVFSGVGKTEAELTLALEREILQINIESAAELDTLMGLNPPYPVKVAFRLNPDVVTDTHAKISTGHGDSKFGMPSDEIANLYVRAAAHKNIRPVGLSLHIGSQITALEPFDAAFRKLAELGRALKVETLDFGGGIGVVYDDESPPDLLAYAGLVRDHLVPVCTRLVTEPGRFLVAESGVLLTRIVAVKTTPNRPILILDAGMNDLVRPAMYDASHRIIPVKDKHSPTALFDIAGPVCESSDIFALNQAIMIPAQGDLMAIMDVGAYGFAMASPYNSRPLPAEVLVDGNHHGLIRRRQTLDDLVADECTPEWMGT